MSIRTACVSTIISEMEKIVLENVQHYKRDFYKFDWDNLEIIDEKNEKVCLVWIVRECGTNLYLAEKNSCPLIECYPNEKYYIITKDEHEWEMSEATYLIAYQLSEYDTDKFMKGEF